MGSFFWVSLFCNLFHKPLGEWNNSKIWETRKTFTNIAWGNGAITDFSLNVCWNQMQLELSYVLTNYIELAQYDLIPTYYKQTDARTARNNLTWLYFQTFDSFLFPCFNSNILYSSYLFCTVWSFVIDLFSKFCSNIRLPLETHTW